MEYNFEQSVGCCPTMCNTCCTNQHNGDAGAAAGAGGRNYYYSQPKNVDACFGSLHPGKLCEDRLCAFFGGHDVDSSYAVRCYDRGKCIYRSFARRLA